SPVSLRVLRPDAPESLENIVMKCLEKDKQWRYQSAKDVLQDLKPLRREAEGTSIAKFSLSKQWVVTWILAIALSVLVFVLVREKPAGRDQGSVAVLPFLNLSDSKEDEYFSQGITEDIITQLSKISNLKVVSFASPAGSGQTEKDLETVRRNAGVSIVLKGSVRTSGLRVRIAAQLLDLQSNSALWAETYERELKDIFNVQTEVARQIGLALESKLSLQTQTEGVDKGDENIETYRLYLQGRYFWNKRTPDGVRKALEYFQQAIARDESYARGYAGLADCYVVLASNTFAPPNEVMPKAKAAAQKALSLNSSLAEAHASLGMVAFWYEWDSRQAEREFKQALALNPNYATARQWYAWYLATLGRSDEAIQEIQKALTLEPLSLVINTEVGAIHYFTGKYEGEVDPYKRALEMDPDFALARLHLGFAYLADERYDEAIQELESAVRLSDSNPTMVAALGNAYVEAGKKNLAEKILAALRELSKKRYVSPAHLAGLCSTLGRNEDAFTYLTKALEERSASLVWMKMGRGFNSLRSDPRFVTLLNAITLEK
ncbi:MAG: tetratricopeptide repeat protein, partial [Bacteroidota bacterium]